MAADTQTSSTQAPSAHTHGVPTHITSGVRSTNPDDFAPVSALQELWRFTPIARLQAVEGGVAAAASVIVTAPDGITASRGEAVGSFVPGDRIAAMIWSKSSDATIVDIPSEATPSEPVKIDITLSNGTLGYARVLIRAGVHSQSAVELSVTGSGSAGLIVEAELAANSQVTFTNFNDVATTGNVVLYLPAGLARDSVFRSHVLTVSGGLVRVVPTVDYQGPGADAELNGAFIAGPGDHVEHRCLADHKVPNCRSNVTYKGVLGGSAEASARTVWIGDVLIHATAIGTDTYEMNRNLVLNEFARADSVPNLEIETGEIVGAGHASATGRLDDEQVFYLQSRGLDAHTAKSIIVSGFFEDLLSIVPNEAMALRVRARLAELLG